MAVVEGGTPLISGDLPEARGDRFVQRFELTLDRFLDHAAKWHGDAAVVTGGVRPSRLGYAELRERALRFSGALAAADVGLGERVATLAWNGVDHMTVWYGTMGIGRVCHTLNPRLPVDHLVAMTRQAQDRVLAFGEGLADLAVAIAGACPSVRLLMALDDRNAAEGADVASVTLETFLDRPAAPVAWGRFGEDTVAGLCFTSGTTGAPKGVVYTHRSNYLHTLRQTQADALGLRRDDRVLAAVPMFHANGWGLPFSAPAVGATLVLPGRDTSGPALARLVVEEDVTVAAGVPTVWLGLADHLAETGMTLPSLRRLYLGGAPLPYAMQQRLEERLGASVHATWGMTELSPMGTIAANGTAATAPGSSGTIPMGLDLRLTDAAGTPLVEQRGVEGHLQARGDSVVGRYLGADDPATDADGWFPTGDLATISGNGDVTITGRAKDLIKSGGEWINPAEIEAIAGAVPGVALAAVVGRVDPKWGERPVLVIEEESCASVSDETLVAALIGRIARWWLPDAVHRIERMPLAATGKVDKVQLRARYGRPET